jgi:hypothetical protein
MHAVTPRLSALPVCIPAGINSDVMANVCPGVHTVRPLPPANRRGSDERSKEAASSIRDDNLATAANFIHGGNLLRSGYIKRCDGHDGCVFPPMRGAHSIDGIDVTDPHGTGVFCRPFLQASTDCLPSQRDLRTPTTDAG